MVIKIPIRGSNVARYQYYLVCFMILRNTKDGEWIGIGIKPPKEEKRGTIHAIRYH